MQGWMGTSVCLELGAATGQGSDRDAAEDQLKREQMLGQSMVIRAGPG